MADAVGKPGIGHALLSCTAVPDGTWFQDELEPLQRRQPRSQERPHQMRPQAPSSRGSKLSYGASATRQGDEATVPVHHAAAALPLLAGEVNRLDTGSGAGPDHARVREWGGTYMGSRFPSASMADG